MSWILRILSPAWNTERPTGFLWDLSSVIPTTLAIVTLGDSLMKLVEELERKTILQESGVRIYVIGGVTRRFVHFWGKSYPYALVLWNMTHPEDVVQRGQLVHHKDFNPLNDDVNNLQKLSRSEYMHIHAEGQNNHFFGKKHSANSRKKMSASAKSRWERGDAPPSRKGVWFLRWDAEEAIQLRERGETWEALGRRYQVTSQAVRAALKRRGMA